MAAAGRLRRAFTIPFSLPDRLLLLAFSLPFFCERYYYIRFPPFVNGGFDENACKSVDSSLFLQPARQSGRICQRREALRHLAGLELNDLVIRRALIEERVPMPDFLRFRKAFTPAQNHAAGTGFLPAGAEDLPLA